MATQQEKIQQMYDELYKSKYDTLLKQKEQQLTGLAGQDAQINNNYNSTKSELDKQRQDVSDTYKQKYTALDVKANEGKQKYYGDRDTAAYSSAKNTQSIRDYYAKNNLLQSGESVDALLRNNTDFSNNLGNIYSQEQSFNRDIDTTRNTYGSEEKSYYAQLDGSIAKALSEKDRLLAELQAQRNTINNTFTNDLNSVKAEIEYNKIKDIQAYEEQLRQEAYQKQLAEEQRKWEAEQSKIAWERQLAASSYSSGGSSSGGSSSGYSSGSGSSSTTYSKNGANTYSDALTSALSSATKSRDLNSASEVLNDAKIALSQNYISQRDYDIILNRYSGLQRKVNGTTVKSKGRSYYASAN